jgi:L-malate glycosyltransferase
MTPHTNRRTTAASAIRRVLVIPSWYPSAESPLAGIFVREQAQCLARRFDVTVLTPRFPPLREQLQLRWGPPLLREEDGAVQTWRVRYLKMPTIRRFIPFANADHAMVYYRKFAAAIRRGFAEYVRQCGLPDVIHAHVVLPAGWVAVELARQSGAPIVLTEHSGPFAMHLTSVHQEKVVRAILTGANRVSAVSRSLRKIMNEFCPDIPIDVIGNLIDTDFFVPGERPAPLDTPFLFFCLGKLTRDKGVQHLLQAIRKLLADGFKNFVVHVGGEGPFRPALMKMACELKIEKYCQFLGVMDRAKVRAEMQACDAFVLPSLWETFGVVLGEAMACGKPVLSTRCGGPEEVVMPETGILVPPADVPALAAAMASFLRKQFSFQPRQIRDSVVERFGPESFLEKTARFYADALSLPSVRAGVAVGTC